MPLGDANTQVHSDETVSFEVPRSQDGAALWQLTIDSQTLDVNSRYSYLLWCRDFATTSVVARVHGEVVGFITGFRRPDADDTLFVWQVAISPQMQRQGLGRRMLEHLVFRLAPVGVKWVEATVTPDNLPSTRLFTSFAQRHDVDVTRDELFSEQMLGGGHAAEVLFRIGPLSDVA